MPGASEWGFEPHLSGTKAALSPQVTFLYKSIVTKCVSAVSTMRMGPARAVQCAGEPVAHWVGKGRFPARCRVTRRGDGDAEAESGCAPC